MENIAKIDCEVYESINREIERQEYQLEMIASENIVSRAVMEAQGCVMTNKYAEGYPGKRYYGGCEFVDEVEVLAIERAKKLFGAEYANVQPHSGSQANMAVYLAFLSPGDRILGMNLAHGGHLTHGSPVNFSGQLFEFISYGVEKETGMINYDKLMEQAMEARPKMIVAGASAYPRTLHFDIFADIAKACGATLMVDMAHIAGLVAAGEHISPVPYADVVTSTTHKTLRGPRGGLILAKEEFGKKLNSKIFPGIQGGPLMHVIAAKAVAFKEALCPEFKTYAYNTVANAKVLASVLMEQGINLVSNGTDNHMMLVDLTSLDITGKEAEEALGFAGITVNKNGIPFDTRSPMVTSGIRVGTPALTSRGMGVKEMEIIGLYMADVLKNIHDEARIKGIRETVKGLCQAFPINN